MDVFLTDHETALAQLSERAIRSSVKTLEAEDQLTIALREGLRNGADINDLSALSGLTPEAIRRRTSGSLNVLDDLALMA